MKCITLQVKSGLSKKQHNKRCLINSPFNFLEKRLSEISQKEAHIVVNDAERLIVLKCDDTNPYGAVIKGSVKLDPDFEKFGINSDRAWTTFELSDFIKMNRFCFEKKQTAMELVTVLRNFKAKVDKDVENSDDARGNKRLLLTQKIESNIPKDFKLTIPVFAGEEPIQFEVEVNINDNFECSLISPDANDIVKERGAQILAMQIDKIKTLAPEIAILNI